MNAFYDSSCKVFLIVQIIRVFTRLLRITGNVFMGLKYDLFLRETVASN